MVFDFFRGGGQSTIEEVEATLVEMMHNARHVYDEAMGAVFGGGKSKETKRDVKKTDQEINIAQQQVRRALVMHASVSPNIDVADTLAYMSVVKDVERVGDYSKNLYDLAKYGTDFTTADDLDHLAGYRDKVGQLMDDSIAVFENRDSEGAQQLIDKADRFLDEYDANVKAAFNSEGAAADAVARALYFRFLKRITAHVMNLMTALVAPIHRLDYYDEAKEDRIES
ncbi:MAG: PhoU domain-containing protein [Actinomycetota bacterium]|nr:PhoU domain-containing protein [Actinomycetota bacterium]